MTDFIKGKSYIPENQKAYFPEIIFSPDINGADFSHAYLIYPFVDDSGSVSVDHAGPYDHRGNFRQKEIRIRVWEYIGEDK